MGHAIRIEIVDAPTPDVVHRFRNFGEAVYCALRETCTGTVDLDEIDAATTHFTVRDIKRRKLRSVAKLIEQLLEQHYFLASARLIHEETAE